MNKTCKKCDQPRKNGSLCALHWREYQHEYYWKNHERRKEQGRNQNRIHKEEKNAYSRSYHASHREVIAQRKHRRYIENRDQILEHYRVSRAKNRKRMLEIESKYRKTHPEYDLKKNMNRRARMVKAIGKITIQEFRAIVAKQHGRCFDCGKKKKLTIGHKVPLCLGGSNIALNIVGQCRSCNSRQGGRMHPSAIRSLFDVVREVA